MNTGKKRILVTRAINSGEEFGKELQNAGYDVEYFPTIEIKPVDDYSQVDKRIKKLKQYDGIFFTSANAVNYFFKRCNELKVKVENKIYAVGEKTKEKVEEFGYKVHFVPETYSAEQLISSLPLKEIKGKSFLFPRGNLTMKKLKEGLKEYANIDEVEVYANSLPLNGNTVKFKKIVNSLKAKEVNCLTFFSPSSITNFMMMVPDFNQEDIIIAVIGNTTKTKAIEYGLIVDIMPVVSTADSLAESIVKYFKKNN
ncbi:MAG: uroporphyrinogen-III synthase [Ignavibacteriae bacterium]|nr:MAG: uroporphyrinogen-III synthase [Ignavibacteriota bacterium]